VAAKASEGGAGLANILINDMDGAEVDDVGSEIDDLISWSEMERYCINFEEWIVQNQESKTITKLPMPVGEPSSKKDEVALL
jgi:hypothetical protein